MSAAPNEKSFADISTIHGLIYISDRLPRKSERIFWMLILAFSSIMFVLLMRQTTDKFLTDQIIIKLVEKRVPIGEIPFPAVTICPEALDLNTTFKSLSTKDLSKALIRNKNSNFVQTLNLLLDTGTFDYATNLSVIPLLDSEFHLKFLWLVIDAKWRTRFSVPFTMILTKWGFCFSFNMLPVSELLHMEKTSKDFHNDTIIYSSRHDTPAVLDDPRPWKVAQASKNLVMEKSLYFIRKTNWNPLKVIEGHRVIIHGPYEFPSDSSYYFYFGSNSTLALIYPEMTLLSVDLKTRNVAKRNCFLDREKPLKFFKFYNKENCQHECLSLKFSAACGCVLFYQIRGKDDKICSMDQRTCYEKVFDDLKVEDCGCLERCEEVKYRVKLEFLNDLNRRESQAEIRFTKSTFQPFVKTQSVLFSDYLGSIGGIMGLIAGVSVLSLIEFVYHYVAVLSFKVRSFVLSRRVRDGSQSQVNQVVTKVLKANENHALYQLTKYFGQFMRRSDIHGIKYIISADSNKCGKLFWVASVTSSFAICCILTSYAYKHAERNPVAIGIDDHFVNVEDIPFPAVTYCPDLNMDLYLRYDKCYFTPKKCNETNTLFRDAANHIEVGASICNMFSYGYLSHMFDETHSKISKLSFLTSLEHLTRFDWFQEQSFCHHSQPQMVTMQTLTSKGLCFTFNTNIFNILRSETTSKDFTTNTNFTLKCKSFDESQSRSLSIDLIDDRKTECISQLGYIMIQNQDTYPHEDAGEPKPQIHTTFVINPIITTTDEGLRSFDPKRRNCYFPDEKELRFFKTYSYENCLTECLSNATFEVCGCKEFFDIRDKIEKVCDPDFDEDCTMNVAVSLNDENSNLLKACDCLDDCNQFVYDLEIINDALRPQKTSNNASIASVKIRFSDDQYVAFKRYATHGTIELLSVVGGLLGLFLGVSMLSIVEFFYFFIFRFIINLWWIEDSHLRNPN